MTGLVGSQAAIEIAYLTLGLKGDEAKRAGFKIDQARKRINYYRTARPP